MTLIGNYAFYPFFSDARLSKYLLERYNIKESVQLVLEKEYFIINISENQLFGMDKKDSCKPKMMKY